MADLDKTNSAKQPHEPETTYQRAAWRHVYRWILFIFVAGMDISMPMSLIERASHHLMAIKPLFELGQFGFLFIVNCYFLPVCLLEVNYVVVRPEEILVANLLWEAKLTKGKIISLTTPRFLAAALLRTARWFYLINKSDIPNSEELIALIQDRFI